MSNVGQQSSYSNPGNSSLSRNSTKVKMKKNMGVYYIPVDINGSKMDFVFDTGASSISISEVEARYLFRNGTLTQNDFKGTARMRDAKGEETEVQIINLKRVKIGEVLLHDIEATVIPNNIAPLLIGQSVFEEFETISINYDKLEISLEN